MGFFLMGNLDDVTCGYRNGLGFWGVNLHDWNLISAMQIFNAIINLDMSDDGGWVTISTEWDIFGKSLNIFKFKFKYKPQPNDIKEKASLPSFHKVCKFWKTCIVKQLWMFFVAGERNKKVFFKLENKFSFKIVLR